jgi:hypothetical protein
VILQVITETIRVANPVALLWREAQEDVPLPVQGEPIFSLVLISSRTVKSKKNFGGIYIKLVRLAAQHDRNYYTLSKT